jgi:hypothetical protein
VIAAKSAPTDGEGAGPTGVIVRTGVIFTGRFGGWREIVRRAVATAV